MKNLKSNLLILIGVLLILASLGLTMYNLYEDDMVEQNTPQADDVVMPLKLDAANAEYIPDYQLDEDFEMPVVRVDDREYIGRIDIGVLGISLPVLSEFTYPNLKIAPVRYVGDIYDGTCIIGAHNYNSHFGKLKNLQVGDALSFTDMDGNVFQYRVKELQTLDGKDVAGLCEGDWDLTLFTCTYGGRSRVTVRCECTDGLALSEAQVV